MDYSFAIEYDGPPLPYSIPRAIPLDMSHIPMASPAPPSSTSSVPVVHPLSSPLLPAKPPISTFSPTSVIETGVAMDRSAELTEDAAETSGPVSQSHRVSIESNSEFDFRSRSSGSDQEDEDKEEDEDDFMDRERTGPSTHQSGRHLVTFCDPTYSPGLETLAPRRSTKKGGSGRRLYVTCTSALDSTSVDSALRYAKEVLRWEDEKPPIFVFLCVIIIYLRVDICKEEERDSSMWTDILDRLMISIGRAKMIWRKHPVSSLQGVQNDLKEGQFRPSQNSSFELLLHLISSPPDPIFPPQSSPYFASTPVTTPL
ncbi:extra-large guanine nucleotide-binding protein 1-like protein [Carex littledalei]|uniref:Extra-large guanine nucleotide-binding protein 1-like protein n=1 Tax=Carex littledalei TaxID=544730 RepID=A0A833R9N1_9POAL|nr:extra-large guanine nucleotide-binding protein 1-like protein [Carex littledalei]